MIAKRNCLKAPRFQRPSGSWLFLRCWVRSFWCCTTWRILFCRPYGERCHAFRRHYLYAGVYVSFRRCQSVRHRRGQRHCPRHGRRRYSKAGYASAFALWGCLGVTALYSLCAYIWADPFIDLLGGTDPQVHALAKEYLFCTVTLGGLPTAVATLLSHLIRSEGRSLHASTGIALGGLLNMALDPLFMFVLLPAGREVLGAAVATSLSNVFALLYFVWVLIRKRKRSCLSFIPGKAMLSQAVPMGVLAAGLPACLMTLFENISFAVLDALMAVNGISFQAGLGVAKR